MVNNKPLSYSNLQKLVLCYKYPRGKWTSLYIVVAVVVVCLVRVTLNCPTLVCAPGSRNLIVRNSTKIWSRQSPATFVRLSCLFDADLSNFMPVCAVATCSYNSNIISKISFIHNIYITYFIILNAVHSKAYLCLMCIE